MKIKPDIRAITKLVPPEGNLVQGQSELPIDARLAAEAARVIAAGQNHYGSAEGVADLRAAVAEKIKTYNGLTVDAAAKEFELLIKAIIVCTPANPSGKVMTTVELEAIADVCREFDLLCVADEVYEHYVTGEQPHVSIASLPEMRERTITVNSFSKSWNISGWRLGYAYGDGKLVAPLNAATNVIYVCAATPLQTALSKVLMADADYYNRLRDAFDAKRHYASEVLRDLGFEIYDSGSAFYIWARIPPEFDDAIKFNEKLMRHGVGATPGSAFADTDDWDAYMRICIAREDGVLHGALDRMRAALRQ